MTSTLLPRETIKKNAHALKAGDVLVGSRFVVEKDAQRAATYGKVDVTGRYPGGTTRTRQWGAYTTLTVYAYEV